MARHPGGRTYISCVLVILSVVILKAQPLLSVEDAIAAALQNNYDIQLAENDSSIAALDYQYRNAVFLPRINALAGVNWNVNNQKQEFTGGIGDRVGDVITNNVNGAITLNWTLFDGLKMFVIKDKAEEFIRLW